MLRLLEEYEDEPDKFSSRGEDSLNRCPALNQSYDTPRRPPIASFAADEFGHECPTTQ